MANYYSNTSLRRLKTCDPNLQRLFTEVLKEFDHSIICGFRSEEEQNEAFEAGKSKLKYPQSKHNSYPSKAIDVIPFPVEWEDRERMTLFAGYVLGKASAMGIKVRWGGDWDQDTEVKDNSFDDLVHFELV